MGFPVFLEEETQFSPTLCSSQGRSFHFKTANKIVKENDIIYIEKLKLGNSFKSLNKSMRDVAWKKFFNILFFKAVEAGRKVIEVLAQNPSQICSQSVAKVKKGLSVRLHKCLQSKLIVDRDYNSALNILRLGMSLQLKAEKLPASSW